MAECNRKEQNLDNCTCTNEGCEFHGFCCLCVENHRSRDNLPACLREEQTPRPGHRRPTP